MIDGFVWTVLREEENISCRRERAATNLISHERQNRQGPDFLPDLQRDILDVVKKYVAIREDHVSVRLDRTGDASVLELNVTLPEN